MNSGEIPDLDKKGLRKFGLTFGAIIGGLFGLVFPLVFDRGMPLWPWAIFVVSVGLALIRPASLRLVYRAWMRFGLVMSRITTPIILGLVFFIVVTPIGILKRLTGGDAIKREWDADADSYRVASAKSSPEDLEKPY